MVIGHTAAEGVGTRCLRIPMWERGHGYFLGGGTTCIADMPFVPGLVFSCPLVAGGGGNGFRLGAI